MKTTSLWFPLLGVLLISCAPAPTAPPTGVSPEATHTLSAATPQPSTSIDLTSFQQMARESPCADIRNRLFLVDGQLVFWEREGNCADAAYEQRLFGSTPDDLLCEAYDSIAGPIRNCQDERYSEIFERMIENLDRPDLGLGPEHQVQPIPF